MTLHVEALPDVQLAPLSGRPPISDGPAPISDGPASDHDALPSDRLARLAEAAALDAATAGPSEPGLSAQAIARVLAAMEATTTASTMTAYRSDWRRFTAWCEQRGHPALPTTPALVAAYVTAAATEMRSDRGRFAHAPTSLTRWVSSINQVHGAAGFDPPGRSDVVRRALTGIRQVRAAAPRRVAPLLLDDVRGILASLTAEAAGWPSGVAARRDAAILLFGFAGAFRRGELVALTLADVTLHPADGLHVRTGAGATTGGPTRALPYGRSPLTCAPCAWTRWRQILDAGDGVEPDGARRAVMAVLHRQSRAAGEPGAGDEASAHVCRTAAPDPVDDEAPRARRPLFPGVHKTGAVADTPLTGEAVRKMVQRRGQAAGLTAPLGGHSLRAGFITEAFRQGADASAIMRQTGHRDPASLVAYAPKRAPLVGNAVTVLGL